MSTLLSIKIKFDPFVIDSSISITDLIAILSILVTVLIGWQIWNIIDFNNRIKAKIQESESKLKEEFQLKMDDIRSNAKKEMEIYVRNKFMEENRRRTLWNMYNYTMQFLNTRDFDTAFRLFCNIAKKAYIFSETEILNNALYMAETVINISDGNFTPNKRAFTFYKEIEDVFKKIDTEQSKYILNFAHNHYGNPPKGQNENGIQK
ncbi:MAG TPA: hypothetical protein H9818_09750 [Candidatus Phocaeicola gallistercoris]|nr:hypothetical protein [Candidatus Phocaeicola gallistercoris]